MGKRLQTVSEHVTDITISTSTVDIQVMRIGTKQMTLAVFRQLPEKDMFDEYGNLLAPPWGWVNYDRFGPERPFVFSYEGILYRCRSNPEVIETLTVKAETEEKLEGGYYSEEPMGEDGRYTEEQLKRCVWTPAHKVSVPTGIWLILSKYGYAYQDMQFTHEAGARKHLANRLRAAATLKAAPQLFIGV